MISGACVLVTLADVFLPALAGLGVGARSGLEELPGVAERVPGLRVLLRANVQQKAQEGPLVDRNVRVLVHAGVHQGVR